MRTLFPEFVLFLIWFSQLGFIFILSCVCAYNFIRVIIFLFPKPWLFHTNTQQCMINFAVQLYVSLGEGGGTDTHSETQWHYKYYRDFKFSILNYKALTRDSVQWRDFVNTVMNLCGGWGEDIDHQLLKMVPAPFINQIQIM